MSSIAENIQQIKNEIGNDVTLIAVSKTKPNEAILEAYQCGQRDFGENRVQELTPKHEALPNDIRWHLIGHLQSNKVKYIAEFIHLIHSVDSFSLLKEINKQAQKHNRVIDVLLQMYIAQEETKFGLSEEEAKTILSSAELQKLNNIRIVGLMGMASNTANSAQVKTEFELLKTMYSKFSILNPSFAILSMGMSSDYSIAISAGSNMIRVGSTIFGNR
jgi:PLP dependent protein